MTGELYTALQYTPFGLQSRPGEPLDMSMLEWNRVLDGYRYCQG